MNFWIKFGENGVKKIGLFESIIFFNWLGEKKINFFFFKFVYKCILFKKF